MKKNFAVIIIIIISAIIANAQISINDGVSIIEQQKTLSPYFQITSDDTGIEQFPLLLTKADVNIVGVIAEVTVTQVYQNNGKKPIEAIYVFPASTRAAVFAMKMTIGERVLIAEIQKKEEARATYEKAKQEGRSASLLEQQRPNVFQMNVANIMPGDSIIVELKYTELLVPTDKIYEFVYPTVVGPRYSNKSADGADEKDKFVETPYQHEGEKPKYKFDININLTTGVPLNEVSCGTHKMNLDRISNNQVKIELDKVEEFSGNRDFVLQYKLVGENIETGLILSDNGKEKFFLLMLQPPKKIDTKNLPAREYIFVMDVSGSMRGFPLDVSKDMMNKLFAGLKPTDKFNILFFSGSSSMLFEKSQSANLENIERANEMLSSKIGGGGTELLPALNKIYEYPKEKGYSRTILILTDGYVSVEKEAFELIRNKLSDANVFAFGIGSGVNRYLIEGIARAGLGDAYIIMNQKESPEKAEKFFNYINSPIMTSIEIEYDGFDVYDVEPRSIPDVFADRPIILFGKWKDDFGGNIKVSGLYGKERYYVDINVLKFATRVNNDALKYLWARNKISELNDYRFGRFDDEVAKEVTELGLNYNLLTEYTSFVAVDYLKRNEGDSVITVKQALPLPEGVSDYAVEYGGAMGGVVNAMAPMVQSSGIVQSSGYVVRGASANETMVKVDGINKSNSFISQSPPRVDLTEIQKILTYPELARQYGFEGKVLLRVLIGVDGNARDIEVTYSDFPMFDSSAINAVRNTLFIPAQINGSPTEDWVTIPIQFKFDDDNSYKINKLITGSGETVKDGQMIKFRWTASGKKDDINLSNEKGELSFVLGSDEKYKDINNWFWQMQKNEIRTIAIPQFRQADLMNLFNLNGKLKELNSFEIELIEFK